MDTPAAKSDSLLLHNGETHVSEDYHPSKVHILVVDDDVLTRKILSALLRKYSYNVSVVGSGSEAWDLLKQQPTKFDLVLTDVMMPVISGITLLQMINEDAALRDIPVILMSGTVVDSKTANETIKSGGQDYLSKPIGKDLLKKKVDMVLQNIWQKRKEQEYKDVLAKERHKGSLLAKQMADKEHEIDELRRKMNEMTANVTEALESPLQAITRKIDGLLKDKEWSQHEGEIRDQLARVIKELGSSNLYKPTFEKLMTNDRVDPVTKSFLVTEFTGAAAGRRNSIPTFPTVVRNGAESKEGIKSWEFEVFQFSEAELLPYIVDMFENFQLLELFRIDMRKLQRFIMTVHSLYKKENRYHNFIHAFDVAQACYSFLTQMNAQQYLTHLDILALLVSALCHDLDHPGFNNVFQVNAQTELAIKYNDVSVLENHHASLTFRVLQDPECDVFHNLNDDQKKEIRRTIIQLVLATDMSNHFEHVSKFRHHVETQPFDRNKKEDRQMILNMLLKCADLSNVAKPWHTSENWSNRVADEFFTQADFERDNKYPVAPFMDRFKTTRPRIAADFQDFVALPMFRVLAMFLPGAQQLLEYISINRQNWQARLDDSAYNVPDVPPPTPLDTIQEELDPPEDLAAYEPEPEDPEEQEQDTEKEHDDEHDNEHHGHEQHNEHVQHEHERHEQEHHEQEEQLVSNNTDSSSESFSSPSGPPPFFRTSETTTIHAS